MKLIDKFFKVILSKNINGLCLPQSPLIDIFVEYLSLHKLVSSGARFRLCRQCKVLLFVHYDQLRGTDSFTVSFLISIATCRIPQVTSSMHFSQRS